MNRSKCALGAGLLLFLVIWSCSTEGPTQGTPLSETETARTGISGLPSGSGVSGAASSGIFNTPSGQEADEQFNCTNVQHVQARFSSPGFVNDNVVGLFLEFSGFPDVNRTLRIWWDEENAPEKYQDVPFENADLWRIDDLMAFDKVVEHTYSAVSQPTEFRVRVELSLADQTGNCARVRDVTVAPAASAAAPPAIGGSYCQDFNLSGFSCPTGATQYCTKGPVDSTNPTQAQSACEECYGAPCYLETADCAGPGFGPNPAGSYVCGRAYFGYTAGCSGAEGRIWSICGSYTTYGRWAP